MVLMRGSALLRACTILCSEAARLLRASRTVSIQLVTYSAAPPSPLPHCAGTDARENARVRPARSFPRRRASRRGDDDAVAGAGRASLARVAGDIIILGIGGKIGPTLARLAKRAAPGRRVIGVARFSEAGLREKLTARGIECIEADLLDRARIEALPKLPNVIFMAGRKFGSTGDRRPDLGDERVRAGAGGRGIRRLAYRRLLDRQRLSVRQRASRRRDRANAGEPAARRLRQFVRRRARACFTISRARAGHPAASSASTTQSTCATACCTTSPRAFSQAKRSTSPLDM